jgi:hypothetical protein
MHIICQSILKIGALFWLTPIRMIGTHAIFLGFHKSLKAHKKFDRDWIFVTFLGNSPRGDRHSDWANRVGPLNSFFELFPSFTKWEMNTEICVVIRAISTNSLEIQKARIDDENLMNIQFLLQLQKLWNLDLFWGNLMSKCQQFIIKLQENSSSSPSLNDLRIRKLQKFRYHIR